jgi:hypothetical protein
MFVVLTLAPALVRAEGSSEALWITATGHSYVAHSGDKESARRRALGDALVSAGLAGGTSIHGYSSAALGHITGDFIIARPTGKILRYETVGAQLNNGQWTVSVRALVGPAPQIGCAPRRTLVMTATPPRITISPRAPAWTAQIAQTTAETLMDAIRRHPAYNLERVYENAALTRTPSVRADMDYLTLTRGRVSSAPGDHVFKPEFRVEHIPTGNGANLRLTADLVFTNPAGQTIRHKAVRETRAPKGLTYEASLGLGRSGTTAKLTKDLDDELHSMLDMMACEPPRARLTRDGTRLTVPIGRKHGLSKTHLAFVETRDSAFDVLEITKLTNGGAELRPLDPTRPAQSFEGLRVEFLEGFK